MNGVFIVPTGLGCEIGGHAGDATPAAKLIASICDKLFIHPNVVNASDINEMSPDMIYTEGSILDRFLYGEIGLKEKIGNKILLAVNKPVKNETINAVSAARATIGANIEIVELNDLLTMDAFIEKNKATGKISGINSAINQLSEYDFDVLVVNSPINVSETLIKEYLVKSGGINIWGGVEALLSRQMSRALNRPVIHAPIENSEVFKTFNEIVDPRKSAEVVSICYLHCCLKGAHVSPKIVSPKMVNIIKAHWVSEIDFLITPINIYGSPHDACVEANIPIIVVEENKPYINSGMVSQVIKARTYLEAAGIICAMKEGLTLESVQRPLGKTEIINAHT